MLASTTVTSTCMHIYCTL